jgi:hypothetical protein
MGEKQIEENKKNEILKAYKRGIDQQYFSANLPYYNEIKFISKITNFKVRNDEVIARFQNGFISSFDPHFIADNPDDFYNLISSYMFVKIKKGSTDWYISDIYSIEPPNNYEIAKELFELADSEKETFSLLLQSFGYDPTKMEVSDRFLTCNVYFHFLNLQLRKDKLIMLKYPTEELEKLQLS